MPTKVKRRQQKAAHAKERKARARKIDRKVSAQRKDAAIRAKYGPSRRSSLVTVRSLATGEVLAVKPQWQIVAGR